ncbi:MAG: ATP-binding protein [Methylobacterium sp.]|nr:ABC transporter ATP-binding protein [Methylobacterium sp.]MBP29028.1 ATP-binding protein [Methylobacterium sp.]
MKVRGLCTTILRPTHFELADGDTLIISGSSGAGKTLLLRAIADLDPSEGEVEADGLRREQMSGPHWRRLVRYVAAEPAWWAERVGEHFRDSDAAGIRAERLGLPDGCMKSPISRLSTGEKQRLGFLRATEHRPRILLLDEPTASLDPRSALAVETMLRELLDEGASAVVVTHSAEQAKRLGGRCMQMDGGRLAAVTT